MAFRQTKKILSLLVLFFFLISNLAWAIPEIAVIRGEIEAQNFPQLRIPSEIGSIKEIYHPASGKGPFVIHIQASHANYETARQVERIIRYLNEQYGVRDLFVEGASEKLHPEILSFDADAENNEKILDALAQSGELTGAELAISDSRIRAFGIETPGFYKAAFDDFKKVIDHLGESEKLIENQRIKLDRKASKVFSPGFRQIFEVWQKHQANRRDFSSVAKFLREQAKEELGLDFEDPFSQFEWPELTRLALLQGLERRIVVGELKKERAVLKSWSGQNKIRAEFGGLFNASEAALRPAFENFSVRPILADFATKIILKQLMRRLSKSSRRKSMARLFLKN